MSTLGQIDIPLDIYDFQKFMTCFHLGNYILYTGSIMNVFSKKGIGSQSLRHMNWGHFGRSAPSQIKRHLLCCASATSVASSPRSEHCLSVRTRGGCRRIYFFLASYWPRGQLQWRLLGALHWPSLSTLCILRHWFSYAFSCLQLLLHCRLVFHVNLSLWLQRKEFSK